MGFDYHMRLRTINQNHVLFVRAGAHVRMGPYTYRTHVTRTTTPPTTTHFDIPHDGHTHTHTRSLTHLHALRGTSSACRHRAAPHNSPLVCALLFATLLPVILYTHIVRYHRSRRRRCFERASHKNTSPRIPRTYYASTPARRPPRQTYYTTQRSSAAVARNSAASNTMARAPWRAHSPRQPIRTTNKSCFPYRIFRNSNFKRAVYSILHIPYIMMRITHLHAHSATRDVRKRVICTTGAVRCGAPCVLNVNNITFDRCARSHKF